MIPRHSRQLLAAITIAVAAIGATACEKVPLLAPTGSAITLTTPTTALSANGTATIVAQVLESSGTPPHSGTRVTFMTTLGVIEPSETSTDASGRAVVTFRANGASGVAEISASSGGATTSGGSSGTTPTGQQPTTTTPAGSSNRNLTIYVGTAAVGRVLVVASPAVLPTAGGTTTITANILDRNGNALSAAPVTFSTTAGTMSASVVNTDAQGNAVATLTTFQAATVTATVGIGSGATGGGTTGGTSTTTSPNQSSVTVSLTSAPTVSIVPPQQPPPSAGLPATFTIKVTPASAGGGSGGGTGGGGTTTTGTVPIRELIVDWGDGTRDNFGAVSGDQIATHTYNAQGTYLMSATVTDVAGGSARVSTSVSVIPVPQLAVIVTPAPQTIGINGIITFAIQITVPQGIGVQNTSINFGDGEIRQLGGATSVSVTKSYATAGVRTVTVTVLDTTNRTVQGTATVSVIP